MSDKEYEEILDNIKGASDRIKDPLEGLKHLTKWGQKAVDYFRKQLSEECQNSECYFEHEGYCTLEEIDLLDEEVDLNISFDCPKLKLWNRD